MDEGKISYGTKIKSFVAQCRRVWHLLRKPSSLEFKTIAKVSAIGILILGAIGFLIADIIQIARKFFI